MLRLSRSDEMFQRTPVMGMSEWNNFLQQYPQASNEIQSYARNRVEFFSRLQRTQNDNGRTRRDLRAEQQNEF